ncbi:MAG: hypothetical protein MR460_17610 [Bilophila wadsworthia]|uniref:DUF6908 domain-containing protein n=1 Tax=Bilophila wadsworthia TaxID=35833 RepID=UPI00242C6B0C|nr:hypothetical protein [Bilophila wadsworthia]MCI6541948.1 hypothetical protein [Bilophila wadsworthia]
MRAISKKAQKVMDRIVELLGKKDYLKIDNAPGVFMPLSVDRTGDNTFALAHYGEQNGDLMADPDMVFWCGTDGRYYPVSYQNDYMGVCDQAVVEWKDGKPDIYRPKAQAGMVKFANVWMNNIASQQDIFNVFKPTPDGEVEQEEQLAPVLPEATEAPVVVVFSGTEQGCLMPLPGKPARRIADRIKKKAPKPIKATTIEPARQTTPPVPVVTECEDTPESARIVLCQRPNLIITPAWMVGYFAA